VNIISFRILYEFKVNENDKIHCVYCISGQLKKDNELSIELIPEEKLEGLFYNI